MLGLQVPQMPPNSLTRAARHRGWMMPLVVPALRSAPIVVGLAVGQASVVDRERLWVLLIVMAVLDVGTIDAMGVARRIEHRPGGHGLDPMHARVTSSGWSMRSVRYCQVSLSGHQPMMLG